MMAIVVRGDALNPEQIQKAFDQIEEVDAVVSTIGGTPADPTADSQVPKTVTVHIQEFIVIAKLTCCTSTSPDTTHGHFCACSSCVSSKINGCLKCWSCCCL